ncbi:MAG: glutamine synthetase family protein [Oscillospiraceae bacterium]|nr:glutamine synthetase family protein [Oscillospiraceae bacterium]
MNGTASEVLEFVKENDVKFIRLSFCDMFGVQKNISIMADGLQAAFEEGVSFDAHSIRGFRDVTESDLFLTPDPSTLAVLPWRPGPGRVARFYCGIKTPDGADFLHDGRGLLKRVVRRAERMGYICKIGAECEFYLFKTDDDGQPSGVPFDKGGYLDASPLDRGEDIRREICLTLEEMGIRPEVSHHEQGPGQNEIGFQFSDALSCADNFQTFKSAVKAIAARNGLFASFMPKPIENAPGSGMHVNLSLALAQDGRNIFKNAREGHSRVAESFIAGILKKTPEMTVFLNPLANSYERFGAFDAPGYVSWSHQNRSQMVRIPAAIGERVRMELRSPDPSANPYLAFALILAAGLDGIESGLPLPPAVDADLYTADASVTGTLARLPESLSEAIEAALSGGFAENVVGGAFLEKYIAAKKTEAAEFAAAPDKNAFYRERYFPVV